MTDFFKEIFGFREERKQLLYIVLGFFLGSFVVARFISILTGTSLYIRGYQIHHFYFGMLILSIGGFISLLSKRKWPLQVASAFMGVGIGLFADEIGLLLNCTTQKLSHVCIYDFPDYLDIVGTIVVVIILLVAFIGFMERLNHRKKNGQNPEI